ncbi:Phosphate transporter PHO1 -like protein 1 [Capsicum baccatum]|uniref:Phosphate transporter PHO1-like protein 1 n=1 Tax=Capsicum baccatum TaxID=33114 RepID=A0A2G2VKC6_CAPBA|nr:Phosphate transporter PHO1 -like protein 1 [Capsicum baccatum]
MDEGVCRCGSVGVDKVYAGVAVGGGWERGYEEDEKWAVHRKIGQTLSKGDLYETELLEQFADNTESATEFFALLDLQLNKVNQFFRTKEKEFVERGECLMKQMEILIELKAALIKQQHDKGTSLGQNSIEDESISGTISCDEESNKDKTEQEQDIENSIDQVTLDSPRSNELENSTNINREDNKSKNLSERMINCQGKSLKIHIPLTNPTRTFSAITYLLRDDIINQSSKKCGPDGRKKLHINRTKLKHAEKMIRGAFIELYKGLGYLKTYRNLNMLAFVKILKKFDKVTNKQVLPIYLRVVESSYFNSSDKALKLADDVEEIFIKHFAEDDKKKAMKYLKPTQKKESHAVTFFIGLFAGCFLALFVGYVIMAHITGLYRPKSDTIYMETVYPVVMLDFFMADQLCSQVPMLRNLEYVACYYITGSYKNQDYGYCMRTKYYRDLAYAVSFLPYYWRAMQCARRWFDEGHKSHLVNLGKYVSAMLAAGAKVAYEKEKNMGWLCLVIVMSSAATVYQLYWDFVKDWGLLQCHSKNPWLRNELILRRKFIYYFSMGLNLVLRLAWLQTVLHYNFGTVDYRVTGLFLAALEVIRRGHWNYYRSINAKRASEHLFRVPTISCVVEDTNETRPESIKSSASSDSTKEAAFNLNLPRRSLLATFTCNACGVRSQKLINRLAYERGTVFIQCSGCSQYHKLVDNLGLVVEYNFKDEISMDLDADQD